jgi:hypothetical protein
MNAAWMDGVELLDFFMEFYARRPRSRRSQHPLPKADGWFGERLALKDGHPPAKRPVQKGAG